MKILEIIQQSFFSILKRYAKIHTVFGAGILLNGGHSFNHHVTNVYSMAFFGLRNWGSMGHKGQ